MKIDRVSVRYGELRTTNGYNNVRHEIELSAQIEHGETPSQVKDTLTTYVRNYVKKQFGDIANENQMELPY